MALDTLNFVNISLDINVQNSPLDSLSNDQLLLAIEILFREMAEADSDSPTTATTQKVYHLRQIFMDRLVMLAEPLFNHTACMMSIYNFKDIIDRIAVVAVKYHQLEIIQLIFGDLVK